MAERDTHIERNLYLAGLITWLLIWAVIFIGVLADAFPSGVLVDSARRWWFLLPAALGATILSANLALWWESQPFGDYATELGVIEFVERNCSWFLLASGTFLAGGSLYFNFHLKDPRFLTAFVTFMSLAILAVLPVASVYWVPKEEPPKKLVLLRHFKTIPFTYAVCFFAAAVLALLLSAGSLEPAAAH